METRQATAGLFGQLRQFLFERGLDVLFLFLQAFFLDRLRLLFDLGCRLPIVVGIQRDASLFRSLPGADV